MRRKRNLDVIQYVDCFSMVLIGSRNHMCSIQICVKSALRMSPEVIGTCVT